MPRRSSIFVQALLVAWMVVLAPALAATELRVLTYNIERGIGSSSSTISAQPSLANVVNYLDPDVWMISELGGTSATFSKSSATSYLQSFVSSKITIFGASPQLNVDYFISVSSYSDGYSTTAYVSRYPFLQTTSYSDAGGGYSVLRGLNYALVDVPGSNGGVGFFDMHLKASNDTDSAARRQAEAATNLATISSWKTTHPGLGLIVGGDWNASADADDGSNWSGHDVGDPITLANGTTVTYDPVHTLLSAGLTDPRPVSKSSDKDTISSTNPTTRFDYLAYRGSNLSYASGTVFDTSLFTTSQLNSMNALAGTTLTTGTTEAASDHLPVLGVFAVVPEPGVIVLLFIGAGGLVLFRGGVRSRPCRRI